MVLVPLYVMILPWINIDISNKKGKGVFTSKAIPAHTVIEISPVIVLSAKERKLIEQTRLYKYVFEWGERKKQRCIALGYISMYNHSYEANCEYEMDYQTELMTIRSVKEIAKGEELSTNYNGVWNDRTPIVF